MGNDPARDFRWFSSVLRVWFRMNDYMSMYIHDPLAFAHKRGVSSSDEAGYTIFDIVAIRSL